MDRSSAGGRDAARVGVYRHALVRRIIDLLGLTAHVGGWSPLTLAVAGVIMSLDAGPTLAQRFESALAVLDAALPRRRRTGRTYQGFIKALTRHAAALLDTLAPRLEARTKAAAGRAWSTGRLVPIGVDGSRFDAPRTIANEALGMAGKDKCGPQMMLVLLVHLGSMLPWAWKIGSARESERALLRSALDRLPPSTLLVADAGFVGFALLSDLRARGVRFLVRVGRGVHLLRELGCYRREGRDSVYLWPDAARDQKPLVLRLIRVGTVFLLTDVTDPRELSRSAAGTLYRRRWGLEVAFRSLKQTLQRRKVRSGTPAHARVELAFAIVGLWTLALLGVRALARSGHRPDRLSIAAALATARRAMRTPLSERALQQHLARSVIDAAPRRTARKAYRWPHKKRPPAPGPPSITTATPTQVRAAQALTRSRHHG